jgi:hypothetical protein
MTLTEIIKAAAERMPDVIVEIDRRLGTVLIWKPEEEDIFLQGDEADQFIAKVDELYNKAGDVTEDEAALCEASPYCENLWN